MEREFFRDTIDVLTQLQEMQFAAPTDEMRQVIGEAYDKIFLALEEDWGYDADDNCPIYVHMKYPVRQEGRIYFNGYPFSLDNERVTSLVDGQTWDIDDVDVLYDFLCYLNEKRKALGYCEALGVAVEQKFRIGNSEEVYWIGKDGKLYAQRAIGNVSTFEKAINPTLVCPIEE